MIRAEAMQAHQTATGHERFSPSNDPARQDVVICADCPWQYPPAAEVADLPPTDPAPAMGPTDDDPGPVPDDQPDTPPLTLRARIENAIDRAFGESNWEPGDKWLPDAEYVGGIVHAEVSAGADFTERKEGTELTPSQALAYLLDLPEWARVARLGMLLEQARKGSDCLMRGHQDIEIELRQMRRHRDRLHHAMMQIARLTATVDQPESVGQSVIGSISSEALVPE